MEIITNEYLPYLDKFVWIKYDLVRKSTELIEPGNHRDMLWGRWRWAKNEITNIQIGYGRVSNNFTTQTIINVLPITHISPFTISVKVDGVQAATDDGSGNIVISDLSYTSIIGLVDYNTGAISVTFTPAPPKSSVITVDYIAVVDENFNGEWVEFRDMAFGVRNT